MSCMQPYTVSQPPVATQDLTQADVAAKERDRPEIRSLKMAGVASSPLLPDWLRKPFRERLRHTPARPTR
jgi:hypothetical protein